VVGEEEVSGPHAAHKGQEERRLRKLVGISSR
jgi:hypothetical protein